MHLLILAFLNYELSLLTGGITGGVTDLASICEISDSLVKARQLHPGQRNSLDALCKRYFISNDHRQLHGALLDSEILADVYLAMTGGQTALSLGEEGSRDSEAGAISFYRLDSGQPLTVIKADASELDSHQQYLQKIQEESGKNLWDN